MATTYRFGPKFRLPLNVLKKKFTMTLTKAPNTILSETESRESQRIQNPKDREKKREKAK